MIHPSLPTSTCTASTGSGTRRGTGVLCRYADDLYSDVSDRTGGRERAQCARGDPGELGLELKLAKTRIVHLREGGEGFDFLGFHHRYVRGNTPRSRHLTFLIRWPSRQAMQHARQRVCEITARERLLLPVEDIVEDLKPVPRRLGGLLPLRKLRRFLRHDHAARCEPAGDLRRQPSPA